MKNKGRKESQRVRLIMMENHPFLTPYRKDLVMNKLCYYITKWVARTTHEKGES